MSVRCADIIKLGELDEASGEYAELVRHLDNCDTCRGRLDTDAASSDTAELIVELKRSHRDEGDSFEADFSTGTHPAVADESELAARMLESPTHPELLGRLGRYDIERVVGQGGMGIVFKAMDTELHRVVAVKALAEHLATNAAARRRFAREAQAAAAVLHPNVIPIYNVQPDSTPPYLVMHYVEGESLQRRVDRSGPLGIVDAVRIAKQTCEALAAAHDQGLVHRDVKPSNILLEEQTDRAVLSDFGLARSADDASLTQTGIVAGTPHYMSPEQAKGREITHASDVFALGSVLYFVLTGRPPFRAESAMGVLHCICTESHRSVSQVNSDVPLELGRLIDRCLAKKPARRPANARQVALELEGILSRIQQGKIRLDRPNNGVSRLLVGLVAVVGLIAGLIAFYPSSNQNDRTSNARSDDTSDSQDAAALPSDTAAGPSDTVPRQQSASISSAERTWLRRQLIQDAAINDEIDAFSQQVSRLEGQGDFVDLGQLVDDSLWGTELKQIDQSMQEVFRHLEQYRPAEKRGREL